MDFRDQIKEDIAFYKDLKPYNDNLQKEERAFNYWILDKLFCEDEEEIENKIIDYRDNGIDCYVWHEESHDLYLIQNKFYSDSSQLSATYFNNAVEDGYSQLKNGTYQRSSDLQAIFDKYSEEDDFYVYHYFYVTNNRRSDEIKDAVRYFNEEKVEQNRFAKVLYLDDIEESFYGEPITEEKHLTIQLKTINKGTSLSVNNSAYGLDLPFDAKYIMLPVKTLHEALVYAENEQYPIFDANIREYLGAQKSVNKGIIKTLQTPEDRNNFFFYNNGITIICSQMEEKTTPDGLLVELHDPQIVNGCQTVSSIRQALDSVSDKAAEKEFKDVFVMGKILEIPGDDEVRQRLRKNIVKYNNSQNSIDEKTFEANNDLFKRLQAEFEQHGFLLLLKQSDKHQYGERFKNISSLKERSIDLLQTFGLEGFLKKPQDFMIPIEKLLQVVLAFSGDAQQAFQKKGSLLKKDSSQYTCVTSAIMSPERTTQRLLNLYLLYLRSEKTKNNNQEDGKIPITWYFIEGFSKIECNGADYTKIDDYLNDKDEIEKLIKLYMMATKMYLDDYRRNNDGKEYNSMIKEKVDIELLRAHRNTAAMVV